MGLLDSIEQSRIGLLDNVAQKELERGLLAPRMQQRTPGSSPEARIAQGPIGQWADKVMSGGFLRENVDRWNAAMENSKAQAFEGAPDTGEGNAMDYFAPMAMVAGKLAKTADLDMLKIAEDAEAQGMSKEKIFDATGWFKGKDGQWRFEIDDSVAKFNQGLFEDATREGIKPMSHRLLDNPKLREAYLDVSYPVKSLKGEMGGAFYPVGKRIEMGAIGGGKKTLSHELQHGIQNKEGFARGGSPDDIQRQMDKQLYSLRAQAGKMSRGEIPYDEAKMQQLIQAQKEADALDSITAYKRLAGEVEARNVQSRLGLLADDRRMLAPWKTEDVPFSEQLIRYGE